jgi:hypothetical protein
MNKASKKLTVTAVLDTNSKTITAFFNELPGLVVQGKDVNDIKGKLRSLLASYVKRLQTIGKDFEIRTSSFV